MSIQFAAMAAPMEARELAIEGDSGSYTTARPRPLPTDRNPTSSTHRRTWPGKFLRSDIALFVIPGIACFISCALTFRLVYLHLKHYHMASRQRYIIRIIMMVPIYAVDSWLSLIFM